MAGAIAVSAISASAGESLRRFSEEIADVVESVLPSVVVVLTEASWFPSDIRSLVRPMPGGSEKLSGLGSGVILDRAGHVMTSRHVIESADAIRVVLQDGSSLEAELVGTDAATDLGVLRIQNAGDVADRLTPIERGDSDGLRVGEIVLAIGSPFSLSSSVSWGIVSQKGRAVGLLPYDDFIQTDAAINPGNSGGPLVNLNGRMVGLNAVIQTAGPRGSIGIGFAVPGNRALDIAQALIEGRTVQRPWLGMVPAAMNRAAAIELLGAPGGVYVHDIFDDTPASRGGLLAGDIILSVNGAAVETIIELQRELYKQEIGATLTLEILRARQRREVQVITGATPENEKMP
jgi:S1-C subfamily serine protease